MRWRLWFLFLALTLVVSLAMDGAYAGDSPIVNPQGVGPGTGLMKDAKVEVRPLGEKGRETQWEFYVPTDDDDGGSDEKGETSGGDTSPRPQRQVVCRSYIQMRWTRPRHAQYRGQVTCHGNGLRRAGRGNAVAR